MRLQSQFYSFTLAFKKRKKKKKKGELKIESQKPPENQSRQITHIVHLDEPLVPRKLNKKKIQTRNTKMSTEKKSIFFFQGLRGRDKENDFFCVCVWGLGGRLFLEINSLSFGKFLEVKVRFNEFVQY